MLTVFIVFSIGFYMSTIALTNMIRGDKKSFYDKYAIIFYLFLIFIIFFFTPLVKLTILPFLLKILPERSIGWFIPDWGYIIEKIKSADRFKSFNVYYDVLSNDYMYLYISGLIGFILSFILNRKGGIFLISFFVIPFLILSFIFREPYLSHYLFFIYPIFLIAIGCGLYFIVELICNIILKKKYPTIFKFVYIIVIIIIFINTPKKEIKDLLTTTEHGQVVKKELFNSTFVNWRTPCEKLKQLIKEDEIIFSTWPQASDFYLRTNRSIRFRQVHYDTQKRQYVENEPTDTLNDNASTYKDFLRTFSKHNKGWLLADYYFDNVMTDPRAKQVVIQNMNYIFDFCPESDLKVFYWNRNIPNNQEPKTFVIELGKTKERFVSEELPFTIDLNKGNKLLLRIDAEGIDTDQEAFIIINGKPIQYITKDNPENKQNIIEINPSLRRIFSVYIDKENLSQNENKLQFGYNFEAKDVKKGYVVYNISLGMI